MASPAPLVRRAALSILADQAGGFNARIDAILSSQGVQPFGVDFAPNSKSFFQGYIPIDAEEISTSQIAPKPCAICMYTTGIVNAKETNARYFAGLVELRIDAYLRLRAREETSAGVESDDTETPMDAIEEAVLYSFREGSWGEINYNGDFKSDRSPLLFVDDGYQQRISIQIAAAVRIS